MGCVCLDVDTKGRTGKMAEDTRTGPCVDLMAKAEDEGGAQAEAQDPASDTDFSLKFCLRTVVRSFQLYFFDFLTCCSDFVLYIFLYVPDSTLTAKCHLP